MMSHGQSPYKRTVGFAKLLAFAVVVGSSLSCLPVHGPDNAATDTMLTCVIRCEPTCEIGSAPKVCVEITNGTAGEISLVGGLDGSSRRWRYPHCYFEIIGPDGKSAVRDPGGCGNLNALRKADFVKVASGAKFDPYQRIDDYGFFSAHQMSPRTFAREGEYKIRFVYSTDNSDINHLARYGRRRVGEIARTFPKTTVRSNEVTVSVVRRGKTK